MRDDQSAPIESLAARTTELGSLKIVRALPRRQRRMVGPWCFLDRYGPISFSSDRPMDVAPHPHAGLQTVSWLTAGEVLHYDSLGCEALMRAGQLNLMTSGHGIAHSEETPQKNSGTLSGVQLWVALPSGDQHISPCFDHYASLPFIESAGATVQVIMGELMGAQSPARSFSPIVGADVALHSGTPLALPLRSNFEHAILVLEGQVSADGRPLEHNQLHYIAAGRSELVLTPGEKARVLLIGGEPFEKPVLMWWNFVADSHEDLMQAREDWIRHERFGDVKAYHGPRMPAPEVKVAGAREP